MRVSTFTSAVLAMVSIAASVSCGDGNDAALQATLVGPTSLQTRLLTVQPSIVAPQFLPSRFCTTTPAFTTQFSIVFATDRDLFVRGMRFTFTDRRGTRISPVPIPDSLPFFGVTMTPRENTLVVFLDFDCGVIADGTLLVEADTADGNGASGTSRATLHIGS
jgi:hypothetical protein